MKIPYFVLGPIIVVIGVVFAQANTLYTLQNGEVAHKVTQDLKQGTTSIANALINEDDDSE